MAKEGSGREDRDTAWEELPATGAAAAAPNMAVQPEDIPEAEVISEGPPAPAEAPGANIPPPVSRPPIRLRRVRRVIRWCLWICAVPVLLIAAIAVTLALSGRSIHLPVWAVVEIEDHANRALSQSHLPPGTTLSLGAVELALERDFSARLVVRDIELHETGGATLLALPEIRTGIVSSALLQGSLKLRHIRLSGASIAMARDAEGRLALSFGGFSGSPGLQRPADLLDAVERMFSTPVLADLERIEADALSLRMEDARAGRSWEVGDGRLLIDNRPDALSAELGMTLLDGESPAQATLRLESPKADSSARLLVTIDRLASGDLAAQAAPLAMLALVEAPISGSITASLDAKGDLERFEGNLMLGAGRLHAPTPPNAAEAQGWFFAPAAPARPIRFDHAELSLGYDAARQRVTLNRLDVQSASLRLGASGTADLLAADGTLMQSGDLPEQLVAQLAFSEVMVDPEGLFEAPARFSGGALDLRVRLDPLRVDIGQLVLREGDEHLELRARFFDGARGWSGAVDVSLNRIGTDRLIRLWPVSVVPRTREWLAENVGQGDLNDVSAALRIAPGSEPRFALDYEFSGAEVRFIKTLPPVTDGQGRSAIQDNSYVVVIENGHVPAPAGGTIEVGGSLFRVPDITEKPARAEVRLVSTSELTAMLSMLDQEPFRFLSKAGQRVDLGKGRAQMVADLRFPLVRKLQTEDVDYSVSGHVRGFSSSVLVPGRHLVSDDVILKATPAGLTLSGSARLDGLPVTARFEQSFGKKPPPAHVRGTADVSAERLRAFGVQLPEGWLSGSTPASFDLQLARGAAPKLEVNSDLRGARMAIAELGWAKSAQATGKLGLSVTLGARPEVTALSFDAPGLSTKGTVSMAEGGGLGRANLTSLRVGSWLTSSAEITGRGAGRPVAIRLQGGELDMRNLPSGTGGGGAGGGGSGGTPISARLDRVIVSSGISLTGFGGDFVPRGGGMEGRFVAAVNGRGHIIGTTSALRGGTAVHITSEDAGRVMAAAGIFANGRGGDLELSLRPQGGAGQYIGSASFTKLSVSDAPTLAAMLSAASVIGLLEQLNGQGILFNEGDLDFRITPEGVQITRGAAVGASMGISFAGTYLNRTLALDIEGTISPIYVLNGIGGIFAPRKGEGLFGFTYRITGTSRAPRVSVNPLSILTPGMFRELFRRPVPELR